MKICCPHCQRQYEMAPETVGQNVVCSACKQQFTAANPNLQPCPDCFAPISKRAAVCPHCGAPLRETVSAAAPDREEEILVCHPGAMNFFWRILLGIFMIPVFLTGLVILFFIWLEIHYTVYRITNLRVIVCRGWIARQQNEIWIRDMRGANLVQGFWQRLIGIGDIFIGTAATGGTEIKLTGIADPQQVVDTINSLRQ